MGKKRKSGGDQCQAKDQECMIVKESPKLHKKIKAKKNELSTEENDFTQNIENNINNESSIIKKNKRKKNKKRVNKSESEQKGTNHINSNANSIMSKPKKIIFVNDEPQEVSLEADNVIKKTKKQAFNEEESNVKDEDIDRFCDEINEEDNVQYETWINLIEAKLNFNKKK